MALRVDEEYGRASFERYLRDRAGLTDATWQPFPYGESKPPDLGLRLGGITYGVEITSLFTQYAQEDGSTLSEQTVWKATERLTDEVERNAAALGILRGGYVLTVDGPYDTFLRSKKQVRKYLMDFIASTRELDETRPEIVFQELSSGQRCAVNKWASQTDWVAAAMHSDGGGWDWSIVNELTLLVEAAVVSKARKLRNVPPPCILLLLDRHHVARLEDYLGVRQAVLPTWAAPGSVAKVFHSIYLIQAAGDVFPLLVGEGLDVTR